MIPLRDFLRSPVWGPGKLIANRYRVDSSLGIGVTARVWSAHDAWTDVPVALKRLHPSRMASELGSLQREAKILSRLEDPRIIRVHSDEVMVNAEGVPFLAMEYVPGESLATWLAQTGPLTSSEVREIGLALCAALACVHAAGLVHRDVRPRNILGTAGQWKLADFGSVQPVGQNGANVETDLFGLALTLASCLEGRRVESRDYEPPANLAADDPPLRFAILRGLSRRFSGVAMFGRALEEGARR